MKEIGVKSWLPAEYMDESIPPTRATPDAWILHIDDVAFALAEFNWDNSPNDGVGRALSAGDIVKFQWTMVIGRATIHVLEEREISYSNDPPPAQYDGLPVIVWEPGNLETITDDVGDITANYEAGETINVEYYVWSDNIPFAFQNGAFRQVAGIA